jgi:hypothetical protein
MSSQVAQRRQSGGNGYRGNNNHRNNRRDNGRYRQDYSTSRRHHESHNNNQAHEPVIPGAFFLGNIDKALTREEVYEFVKNETNCYIKKFDMPNVVGDEKDTQGRPIRCAGFAFVHVKYQWMADEMLSLGKIRIGNLEAEIKPYDQMKRLMSERRHRANTQNLSEHGGDDQVAPPASTSSPKKPSSSSRIVTPRETSSSSRTPHQRHQGYTGTENWAELEGESDYHPGNDWSMKISQFGDHCLEDDSQYQTEDDSASIASRRETNVNVIEPPSSMYSTRASTPSQRHQNRSRMVSKINVPENTIIVGEITQKLIDDGITPTADKINELAAEKYAVEGAIVGEQVSSAPVFQRQESVRSQIQHARAQVEAQQQIVLPQQTPVVVPQQHIQVPVSAVPMSLSVSPPSSINTIIAQPVQLPVVPQTSVHQPYLNSVTHNSIAVAAGQMVQGDVQGYQGALYGELVQQWLHYYTMNPGQALVDLQSNELEQCQVMQVKAMQALQGQGF